MIMCLNFENTVSSICYSIIHQYCQSSKLEFVFPHNNTVRFVLKQHDHMPDFLQLPIIILTLTFDVWALVHQGRLFHQLPPTQRWSQIQEWKNSPIGFCRDLIRFYESLTIFYLYSHPNPPNTSVFLNND